MAQVVTNYEVRFLTQSGILLNVLDTFVKLDYTKTINQPGWLSITIPPEAILFSEIRPDTRIEVRRQVDGKPFYTDLETSWLIRRWSKSLSSSGEKLVTLGGPSALDILRRRIVAYASGSAEADKSGIEADDLMKEIVDENFLAGATDTARRITSYLSNQADATAGITISKAFSRRNVLTVLQEMSNTTVEAYIIGFGNPVYFDIVPSGTSAFEFRTYLNQRGTDRSSASGQPLVFSPDYSNLTDCKIEYDHSEEVTYSYAGGTGVGAARAVESYGNSTRISSSPLNFCEGWVDARNSEGDATQLLVEAIGDVYKNRPKTPLTGKIIQTPTSRYGVEWFWGDKVVQEFDGIIQDVMINQVRVSVQDGQETIDANVQVIG